MPQAYGQRPPCVPWKNPSIPPTHPSLPSPHSPAYERPLDAKRSPTPAKPRGEHLPLDTDSSWQAPPNAQLYCTVLYCTVGQENSETLRPAHCGHRIPLPPPPKDGFPWRCSQQRRVCAVMTRAAALETPCLPRSKNSLVSISTPVSMWRNRAHNSSQR